MLTEEQVYTLGKGDEIIVHGKCEDTYPDGDIRVNSYWTVAGEKREQSFLVHSSCVSLPSAKPKYDPCRLFKKGDMVQPRSGKTVLASEYGFVTFHELAGEYEVNEDEARGTVTLIVNGHACFVSAFALELVTPVEELEPYRVVWPENYQCVRIMKEKRIYKSIPFDEEECVYHTLEEAKAAAEAECRRLNEEYKKEQNND